jgi:hypothetical protein
MGRQVGLKALFCSISFQINIFLGNDCAPHSHQTADGTRSGQGAGHPRPFPVLRKKHFDLLAGIHFCFDNIDRILTHKLSDRKCCTTPTWIPLGPGDCEEHA